jgi:SAM-dependent methyltransferase
VQENPRNLIRTGTEEKIVVTETRTLKQYAKLLGVNFDLLEGKSVLDIGSGLTEEFSKDAAKKGIKVVSMRPVFNEEGKGIGKEFFEDWQRRSVIARGQEMPYEDNSFDCEVALFSVPFYLPRDPDNINEPSKVEYEDFFSEVVRTLKPGGKAYISPIFKNYIASLEVRTVSRKFIENILKKFSDSISYQIDDEVDTKESRLVITKNQMRNNSGFIGILALLIVVCIIIFLMMKGISSITSLKPSSVDQSTSGVQEGSGIPVINSAKNAKNQIEQDNARTMQQLK